MRKVNDKRVKVKKSPDDAAFWISIHGETKQRKQKQKKLLY